jgi:hypothetical protein
VQEASAHRQYGTLRAKMPTAPLPCAALALLLLPLQQPGPQSVAETARELSVEDEVLANIQNQPVGSATIADFRLPEDFLRRYAERIIRSSFESRYRIVVPTPDHAPAPPAEAASSAPVPPTPSVPAAGAARSAWAVWSFPVLVAAALCVTWLLRRRRGSAT